MPRSRGARRATRAVLGALALLMLLALASTASAAERATFRLLGSSPIFDRVDVHTPSGGPVGVRPARYHYRITVGSQVTEASGHCVDMAHYIVTGRDYQVDLQTAADAPELASPEFQAAGWLLSQEDRLIAQAANPSLEAGAIQVAIWQLSGQARGLDAPTSSATLNARVVALRNMAMGKQVTSALDVSITAPSSGACTDAGTAVNVTGTPGATVDLSVTSGPGAVSPAQVVLDENGAASALLTSPAPGQVEVSATTSAPTLVRAAKLAGQTAPQDQLFLRPGTLTDSASVAFVDCGVFELGPIGPTTPLLAPAPAAPGAPGAPIDGPTAPAAPAAPAQPAIALALAAPRLAAPGGVAVYKLTVTNTTGRLARNVTVRQRLGAGVAAIAATGPKGTRASARTSAASWKVSALKPGRSATLTLKVRVGRKVAGGIARSTATAGRAKASGTTAIVRKVGKAEQGH